MNTNISIRRFLAVFLSLCLLLPGAALADGKNGKKNFKEGRKYEEQQQWDMAAQHYALALSSEPGNPEYKLRYLRALQQASLMYVKRGDALAEQNDYASAYTAYRQAYNYDQGNEIARYKMERMLDMQKAQSGGGDQFNYNPRTGNVKPVNNEIQLVNKTRPKGDVATTVAFKETPFKGAVTSLTKQLGLNVVFDDSVKDPDKVTIELQDVTLAKALDVILMQKKYTFEQVDRRTIFVYADTANNRPRFEKLLIKTFYLGNINANTAKGVLAQMLPAGRPIAPVDSGSGVGGGMSSSNTLIVKATPAELQMVQNIIDLIDKNKNEVVLDIEIYEVSRDSMVSIGNQIATSSSFYVTEQKDKDGNIKQDAVSAPNLGNLGGIGGNFSAQAAAFGLQYFNPALGFLVGLPPTSLSFLQSKGNSKLLHKTQIHVLDGGQNTTKVGRSVPVKLGTSFLGGGFPSVINQPGQVGTGQGGFQQGITSLLGGFNQGVDNIQYRDVGLVIEAKPVITNEGYVELQMKFETSDVVASGATSDLTPTFTQRSLNTVARIQDNVTAVVAGVSQESKNDSRVSVPVLGMLPLVGRLFTTPRQDSRNSDIIITVTPHIIRSAGITPKDYLAITGPPMQGFLNQSIEDVVNRAQAEEEQERRLIAQGMQPGVPLDTPAAPPNTQAPVYSTGNTSQPVVKPVGNNDGGNQRVINNQATGQTPGQTTRQTSNQTSNQTIGPVTNVGNPLPNQPVVPEQQPQIPINQSENNSGSDNPQQTGQPNKQGDPDLSQYLTQPSQPVAPASVVSAQRPESVEKAIAKMMIEEQRARRAAEASNKSNKPQVEAAVPNEYMPQGPQQKVTPAVPKMNGSPRTNESANSAATFSLSPKPVKQQIGKTFTIAVEVTSEAQMSGANIALKYDATKLQVKSVRDGGMFGSQPDFSYDISERGILIVRLKQPQDTPTAASGRLITIEFSAVGEGKSEIAFNNNDTKVRVGSAQIPASGSATQVTISRDSVTTSNEK